MPAVLDRPQPRLAKRARPRGDLLADGARLFSNGAPQLVDRDRSQRLRVPISAASHDEALLLLLHAELAGTTAIPARPHTATETEEQ